MKYLEFLKTKKGELVLFLIIESLVVATILLYQLPIGAALYLALLIFIVLSVYEWLQYRKESDLLQSIYNYEKTLLNIPTGITQVDQELVSIIHDLQETLSDLHTVYDEKQMDMENYYTLWIHQVKTPISALHLLIDDKDGEEYRNIKRELFNIEQYVEMVLAYLRSGSNSHDYVFVNTKIDILIKQCIRKYSIEFIARKIRLEYEETDFRFVTDEKWFCFVIEQILSNALKYTKEGSIQIWMEDRTLHIKDTGIGIAAEDLPRIFERGYTGFNGRMDKKASGLGLYLCKTICSQLGLSISAKSEIHKGTEITIFVPEQNKVMD